MTKFLEDIRPFLEAMYFIAGTALMIGLLLTARQVRLIKEDMRTRTERAEREKALEACSRYLDRYVALATKEYHAREAAKIARYTGPIGDFSLESVLVLDEKVFEALQKNALLPEVLPLLNELETIAALFTTRVADERVGFGIIGRSVCSTIEAYYGIIAMCRSDPAQKYWSNTVELYQLWRPRLKKVELQSVASRIGAQIDELSSVN